jgi:hypothetical protein
LTLSAGDWTVNAAAADAATNGIVIEPLTEPGIFNGDIIAFSVRQAVAYNS